MQIPIIASLETWSVDYSRNQLNFQMSPHLNIFKFNLILNNYKKLLNSKTDFLLNQFIVISL